MSEGRLPRFGMIAEANLRSAVLHKEDSSQESATATNRSPCLLRIPI
jgi:hypothetical protein